MLVRKTWITHRDEKSIKGYGEDKVIRKWFGIFLFGFIPLWIDNYETVYN